MQSKATTVTAYLDELPEDRIKPMMELRKTLKKNLPKGFKEVMAYGMITYVVPYELYADGYHTNPKMPLPFISLGSQKNYIALHHMGIYADPKLLDWFTKEYKAADVGRLDMGKGCIRLNKMDQIPYELIAQLATKLTPAQWIARYEMYKPFKKK